MTAKEVILKVQEALQEEAYKGIVRVDSQTMRQIDVRAGDIVEIESGRKTVGIVDRAYPSDIGQAIIRMDGIIRRNAKTGIGENVKVRKADVREAKSLMIAPAQQGIMIQANPEIFKQGLLGRALVKGDIISLGGTRRRRRTMTGSPFEDIFNVNLFEEVMSGFNPFGSLKFIVADTNPKTPVIITENTEVRISSKAVEVTAEEKVPEVTYEDIGGLDEEIKKIREMVELPLKNPEIFERLGIEPPKGVLLHGPPGTGKTLLAKAVANETNANFLLVNGPELTCVGGETEILTNPDGRVKIEQIFEEAKSNGELYTKDPIKEIIIPRKSIKVFSVDDNLKVVKNEIKALTKLNALSYYTIKTKKKGELITSKNHPLATLDAKGNLIWKRAEELKDGDYIAIARKIKHKNRYLLNKKHNKEIKELIKNIKNKKKINKLLKSDITFDRIISIKKINQPKILYDLTMKGPPNYLGGSYLSLLHNSKFYGESEKRIRDLFDEAQKNAPSIIFIDEIDAIAPKREEVYGEVERRMVAQLLAVMDGMKSRGKTIVIGASVTGDTPIMIKDGEGIKILPIGKFVDRYYGEGEEDVEKNVDNIYTLGFDKKEINNTVNKTHFNNSAFKKVRSVFRHKVNEVYEIEYVGGKIRTTGSHSVFVRTKQGLKYKPVALLKPGEILVDLPYKINSHVQKIHEFPTNLNLELSVHKIPLIEKCYEQALGGVNTSLISIESSKHSTTVNRWKRGECIPDELSNDYCHLLPSSIKITPELMRLLGYYAVEGYVRKDTDKEVDFCFGSHEEELIKDLINLMKRIFNVEPSDVKITGSRTNIIYNIKPLSIFFGNQCGKGAHKKHIPSFLFEAPREYMLEFIKGYFDGDGYKFKDGKLQVTSVSEQIIVELNWLLKMHGIKSHITKTIAKVGRKIGNYIINKDSIGYRVNIPKTANPFVNNTRLNAKKARIKSITRLPFNDYVYDLCGCENEAFFGGKSPILLHNTNRPNSLDPALRRPGRFDREISLGAPNKQGRLKILKIHTRNMPLTKDVRLENIADITHGFVGADLEALCKEAAMSILRKVLPDLRWKKDEPLPPEILAKLKVTMDDFKSALKIVRPSALREVLIETPNVKWEDIGGLEELKYQLKESIELPLKSPEVFQRLGIRPPKGILMYGPPGTGKTLLAKAVANESQSNFIYVKGPELLNKFVGESEKGVRKIFEKARQTAPCIIFFDEIDSLAPRRGLDFGTDVTERVVNSLLAEMDGLEELSEVVVIAATNRPDLIDPALLRPGRFDRIIATNLPDKSTRLQILKIHTKNMPLSKDISLDYLAERTDKFSGADLQALCKEAGLFALRKDINSKEVAKDDFEKALEKVKPSLKDEELKKYKEIEDKYLRVAKASQLDAKKLSYFG